MQCLDRDPIVEAQFPQAARIPRRQRRPIDGGDARGPAKGKLIETQDARFQTVYATY